MQVERSAGGVLVKDGEVLVIRTKNLKGEEVYTFPKGLIEPGEDPKEAALREVREETGYEAEVIRPLAETTYWFKRGGELVKKTVYWYLMRPKEKVAEPDFEVEEARWLPLEEAERLLTYRSDRELLRKVREGG